MLMLCRCRARNRNIFFDIGIPLNQTTQELHPAFRLAEIVDMTFPVYCGFMAHYPCGGGFSVSTDILLGTVYCTVLWKNLAHHKETRSTVFLCLGKAKFSGSMVEFHARQNAS